MLLHSLFGEAAAADFFSFVYRSFTYVIVLSLVGSLALIPSVRRAYVFLCAATYAWILGTLSYYVLPSLGPYAAAPWEFAGLRATKITETQAEYLTERAHFLASSAAPDAFVSLGAFASLHVGFSTLVFLMARYYGLKRASRVLAVYLDAGGHLDDLLRLALRQRRHRRRAARRRPPCCSATGRSRHRSVEPSADQESPRILVTLLDDARVETAPELLAPIRARTVRWSPVLVASALAGVLHLLWWRLLATPGGDIAAQDAWAAFARAHPGSAYDLAWYGGMHPVSYSAVSPYLMAFLGVRPTMVVAGTLTAGLLALLLERSRFVTRPMLPAVVGAIALTGNAVSGRVTFGLGMLFGIADAAGRLRVVGRSARRIRGCSGCASS